MGKPTLLPMIKGREDKRWDWTSNPIVPHGQAIVCSYVKCGKLFSEPIELTVRADGSLETYHACPHCFSRVSVTDNLEKSLSKAPLDVLIDASKSVTDAAAAAADCAHFVGYLKTRPKDSPIPDECLTCSRILKCM